MKVGTTKNKRGIIPANPHSAKTKPTTTTTKSSTQPLEKEKEDNYASNQIQTQIQIPSNVINTYSTSDKLLSFPTQTSIPLNPPFYKNDDLTPFVSPIKGNTFFESANQEVKRMLGGTFDYDKMRKLASEMNKAKNTMDQSKILSSESIIKLVVQPNHFDTLLDPNRISVKVSQYMTSCILSATSTKPQTTQPQKEKEKEKEKEREKKPIKSVSVQKKPVDISKSSKPKGKPKEKEKVEEQKNRESTEKVNENVPSYSEPIILPDYPSSQNGNQQLWEVETLPLSYRIAFWKSHHPGEPLPPSLSQKLPTVQIPPSNNQTQIPQIPLRLSNVKPPELNIETQPRYTPHVSCPTPSAVPLYMPVLNDTASQTNAPPKKKPIEKSDIALQTNIENNVKNRNQEKRSLSSLQNDKTTQQLPHPAMKKINTTEVGSQTALITPKNQEKTVNPSVSSQTIPAPNTQNTSVQTTPPKIEKPTEKSDKEIQSGLINNIQNLAQPSFSRPINSLQHDTFEENFIPTDILNTPQTQPKVPQQTIPTTVQQPTNDQVLQAHADFLERRVLQWLTDSLLTKMLQEQIEVTKEDPQVTEVDNSALKDIVMELIVEDMLKEALTKNNNNNNNNNNAPETPQTTEIETIHKPHSPEIPRHQNQYSRVPQNPKISTMSPTQIMKSSQKNRNDPKGENEKVETQEEEIEVEEEEEKPPQTNDTVQISEPPSQNIPPSQQIQAQPQQPFPFIFVLPFPTLSQTHTQTQQAPPVVEVPENPPLIKSPRKEISVQTEYISVGTQFVEPSFPVDVSIQVSEPKTISTQTLPPSNEMEVQTDKFSPPKPKVESISVQVDFPSTPQTPMQPQQITPLSSVTDSFLSPQSSDLVSEGEVLTPYELHRRLNKKPSNKRYEDLSSDEEGEVQNSYDSNSLTPHVSDGEVLLGNLVPHLSSGEVLPIFHPSLRGSYKIDHMIGKSPGEIRNSADLVSFGRKAGGPSRLSQSIEESGEILSDHEVSEGERSDDVIGSALYSDEEDRGY